MEFELSLDYLMDQISRAESADYATSLMNLSDYDHGEIVTSDMPPVYRDIIREVIGTEQDGYDEGSVAASVGFYYNRKGYATPTKPEKAEEIVVRIAWRVRADKVESLGALIEAREEERKQKLRQEREALQARLAAINEDLGD